ncbi:hypothetical protein LWI28_015438 [Acer negundo]|uniref:Carbonic anhydrase n=1 Tax=Acer negundo TaxID=4023 RepID=A0AAD5I914_ACENE|nr:hypothetical protein LWI28_015438 [Acer negundo]KAK4834370.1 hypothetical protein QYF36_021531 [Acer negundo]
MASKIPLSVVAISLFIGLALATVDEEVGTIDFGYSGKNGPSYWGRVKPAYSACSGKNQSPINIIQKNTVLNQNMQLHSKEYKAVVNATLINWGHIIALHYSGHVGWMEINGTKYTFKQMHWHSPSEHLIDGRRYAAELHLVHEAEDHSTAVIAILYRYGNSPAEFDPFLAKLGQAFQKLSKEKSDKEHVTQVNVGMFNTNPLTQNSRKYFRYVGSFTTPPCTENVIWTVLGRVRFISKKQVEALRAPLMPGYKDNARPNQLFNGRQIELHDELERRITNLQIKKKRTNN